jgi:hypothetical protein
MHTIGSRMIATALVIGVAVLWTIAVHALVSLAVFGGCRNAKAS